MPPSDGARSLVRPQQNSAYAKFYVLAVYVCAIPVAILCFQAANDYSLLWFFLTATSIFVATISVRLPTSSAVVSMGDVFTILVLMNFGPGPALITYWSDIVAAHITNVLRKHGLNFKGKVFLYR